MKENYEALDDYLGALDSIKGRVAKETEGMNHEQVKKYFAGAACTLQKATGQTVRVRRERHKCSVAKP